MSNAPPVPVQEPPLPNRVNQVRKMTPEEARGATMTLLAFGAILLGVAALVWYLGYPAAAAVLGLFGLLLAGAAFTRKSLVASCPFCHELIMGIPEKAATQRRLVRCNECFEYSQMGGGKVQAADPATVADRPRFVAPVFDGGVWPQGCVQCGEPATRSDNLQRRNPTIPSLSRTMRAALNTASLRDVPYCAQHKDAVELSVDVYGRLDVKWRSLRMMRRYLAQNRSKTSLGTHVRFTDERP